MKRITKITRRDIFKLFRDGLKIDDIFNYNQIINYSMYGLLTEIEFLKKLYQLNELPSSDDKTLEIDVDYAKETLNRNLLKRLEIAS